MNDFPGVRALSKSLLLVGWLAITLSGCLDTTPAAEEPTPVDEEAQALRASVNTTVDYCHALQMSRRAERPKPHPGLAERRAAERAVKRVLLIADRYDDAEYIDQHEYREHLAAVAAHLEEEDCLPEQIPDIDRFLREMTLPDPPEVEDTSEY